MGDYLQTQDYYPKQTNLIIKQTSLLIEELEIRRTEEQQFQLTNEEKELYTQLYDIFKNQHPVEPIKTAVEKEKEIKVLRKDFLAAVKDQHEKKDQKDNLEREYINSVLFATATPMVVLGTSLLNSFHSAGMGVIVAGIAMYLPALISEITKKRKANRILKKATIKAENLSEDIERKEMTVDKVCNQYGIPINCCQERLSYLEHLLDAASEYERLEQKKTDYELLMQLNESDRISQKISNNIFCISGLKITNETKYKVAIQKLEEQMNESGLQQ